MIMKDGWFNPKEVSYNTIPEHYVVTRLQLYLLNICDGNIGLRLERPDNPLSKDISVYIFDYDKNEKIEEFRTLEVEQKPKEKFDNYPNPPSDWPYWSFLGRKVSDRDRYGPLDIYILTNNKEKKYNLIYWATFKEIRKECRQKKGKSRYEEYWHLDINPRKPFKDNFPHYGIDGYDTLAEHLQKKFLKYTKQDSK